LHAQFALDLDLVLLDIFCPFLDCSRLVVVVCVLLQLFYFLQEEEKSLPLEKIEDQKAIDAKLVPLIEAVPELKSYLASRFGLKSGVKPHELVF
jgi:hypothetical protein